MAINRRTPSATEPPPDGSTPTPGTPTITAYQQLADAFMADLDQIAAIIPKLEVSHISTANFVRGHINVPIPFLATAISGVEQNAELQAVKKLDVVKGRDTLQFIEAFRPVLDKVVGFVADLQYTLNSRKASLTADALQIYDIAKGLARDPGSAALESFLNNLQRDLGHRGKPKRKAAPARKPAPAPTGAPPNPQGGLKS